MSAPPLILASSSPYRRQLLARLTTDFVHKAPAIDESKRPEETPEALVLRLAEEKAKALSSEFNHHLIIGSDQVATMGQNILTKPGTREKAIQQLRLQSGTTVTFLTSVSLLNSLTGELDSALIPTRVVFRTLSESQIANYLEREKPLDCAGSFKMEGLGIALFESISSEDPTALVGLPLIALRKLLSQQSLEFI